MAKKKKSDKKNKDKIDERPFYQTIGDIVSPGTAYSQAASLLDMAAIIAVESGDPEGLGSVAHQWMEMAVLMQGGKAEQGDEPEESFTETKVIGFGTKEMREVAEDDARKSNSKNAISFPG